MENLANTKYPIHELLKKRWSPRAFSERMVEPEKLYSLFEAARWAPSSFNEQPWNFIVATKENKADYDRLLSVALERNRQWAHTAPVLLLTVARLATHGGKPNRLALHDIGLAAENLVLQATALDLFAHQMAGFNAERARDEFAIPSGYEPVTMIAVGYLGDPESLPEQFREEEQGPRSRKPLEEFVFSGLWGQPSPLVKIVPDKPLSKLK
jgi:nitroreductase